MNAKILDSEKSTSPEGRGAVPLHQRIRGDIGTRILSGDWEPGYRIPSEHELMIEYGCARMTVNKALSALTEAGLIERRRRAGSFVRRPTSQWSALAIPDVEEEIRASGQDYRYELLMSRRRKALKRDRESIDVPKDATVLVLRGRHFAGKKPFSLEDRLIALDEVPDITSVDFQVESPNSWLLHHVPWHAAEHKITACNADAETARLLEIPLGGACLVVDRHTWREDVAITAVRTWFPADLQKIVTRFTPSSIVNAYK
jgi:GntR family histidine utilization transcriptional repressor